ncbi:nucleoside triphosphate pyrophosphohydrolase family protein [Methylotenera sp. 1P/1]|uniref:nucleoside triphosphate pyrophosphohydrolase family protein n=1 Tax=Methylotenera sp. 1P/1 TaxID=1131551 RepID=UPI00037D15C1|nr:nucleoside triphosphate pyrophosphohydrolase family protein [Methylotenera sp. 1P/1]
MQLDDYQKHANKTEQMPLNGKEDIESILLPILGLAGEVGSLSTQFKKFIRDGEAFQIFKEKISEELGDILWYVSAIATKQNLSLEEIASSNLRKISDRWHSQSSTMSGKKLFDSDLDANEQFPRVFELKVITSKDINNVPHVQLFNGVQQVGSELTDNAYIDDGYRLHDVFHLSFMTFLGWSPVMRKLFNCKRRSNKLLDENEDGGRAKVIDEAIAAIIFIEAKNNNYFEGIETIEYGILRTIKDLTAHLEVNRCSMKEWEDAILMGFKVWRQLKVSQNGIIKGDLNNRTLEFFPN